MAIHIWFIFSLVVFPCLALAVLESEKGECLGHFDLFVHIERAGRVGLNIKEIITDPAVLPQCLKLFAKRFIIKKKSYFLQKSCMIC